MRSNLRGTLEGYITRPAILLGSRCSAETVATELRQQGYTVVLAQEEGTTWWDVIALISKEADDVAQEAIGVGAAV